ncbi:MAG: double-strand break repair protein AddB, partial [Alphaproteobacteria bacterium]
MTARNIYTIPPNLPFLDVLVAGLADRYGASGEPWTLSRVVVLLPTRRACRAFRDACLRLTDGRPLLLPRLLPIGDIDEDELGLGELTVLGPELEAPPAIPELRRRLLLTRLIRAQQAADKGPGHIPAEQAVRLAERLARLLDQVQAERLSFDRLTDLVPEEYARHWQLTLEFLGILTSHWPAILAEEDCIDPAERRNRVAQLRAEAWRSRPPDYPVVAAGSTGSVPATADLLATIADLPEGSVVLPGLDRELDDESWRQLAPSHPQYGLAQLLERLGVARADVADWRFPRGRSDAAWRDQGAPPARLRLIAETMRPAETTNAWVGV